jgi:flagellar motor switch protein FliM
MAYSNFLSQDEVDAIIANMTGEDSSASRQSGAASSGVRPYDLSSPDRVVRHRMQTLELIHERFGRRMRAVLLNFMRRNADITVSAIRIQKYSDFERNLPVPSNLNMIAMKPLRGTALFTFDPNLVFLIIDSMFGGHGRYNTRVEGRDFTTTEQRIIGRLVNVTLDCYKGCWENIYPLELEYIRSEMYTKFASITSGNEIVVVCSFHIEIGAAGGHLNICIPYSMIEPIRDVLSRPLQDTSLESTDQRWMQQLSGEVRSAEVELVAEFGHIDTTVGELVRMKVNDILPLDLLPNIIAHVGGVPILECSYGTHNHHYALRVEKPLSPAKTEFTRATHHD